MMHAIARALQAPRRALGLVRERTLSRLGSAFTGPYVKAVLVECAQGRFLARPEDRTVGGLLARTGTYGAEELQRILSLTTPDSRVLVVVSHIGALVVPISRKVAHVTAVEANPDTFVLLELNLKLNGCTNVKALQIAASDSDGEIDFVQNTVNSGGSKRAPLVHRHMYFYDQPRITRVRCARLDDVLPDTYDLVLMDIEGSEYFAIKGMPRLISRARHLFAEFLPHHFRDVAGVTPDRFVQLLEPHFDRLHVPSRNQTVPRQEFMPLLSAMFEQDRGDEGIVFSKA